MSVRGFGMGADIGRLREDVPRVRVESLIAVGPDRARLTLGSAHDPQEPGSGSSGAATEYWIAMDERDPGFQILREWLDNQSILGLVLPPGSSLIRLRDVDDLQPLTLRRLDV